MFGNLQAGKIILFIIITMKCFAMKSALILQVLGSDCKLFHLCYISDHPYFHLGFGNLEILEEGDQSLNDSAFVYHLQFFFLPSNARPLLADTPRCDFTPTPRVKSRGS